MSIATLVSGQEIRAVDRDAWLAMRASGLGASDAAAACGVSPYSSPLDLYLKKIGQAEPTVETLAMRIGTLMEPVIAELYEDEAKATFAKHQVYCRSHSLPFLYCTIDGITTAGRIVEFKTLGARLSYQLGEEGGDELPDHWLCQAYQQAFVAESSGLPDVDTSKVEFAVLVGGQDFKRFTVEIDEAVMAHMLGKLGAFWARVEARNPPPVSRPSDSSLMHILHPKDGPEVPGNHYLMGMVAMHLGHIKEAKEADEAKKLGKAKILEYLGDAGSATLPDGSVVTRRVINRAETTVTQKASTFANLYFSKAKGGK